MKKFISGIIIASSLLAYPAQTYAGTTDPDLVNAAINALTALQQTTDTSKTVEQYVKEYVLDGIAVAMAQALSTKMTNSIVNWANGGFKGSPSFVNDFERLFSKSENQQGNIFLNEIQAMQQQNPLAGSIARQLAENGRNGQFGDIFQFTLDKAIGPNWQTFTNGSFNAGGWNGWLALTEQQNNPIGLRMLTENELGRRIQSQGEAKKQEIAAGGGFLGVQKCIARSGPSQKPVTQFSQQPSGTTPVFNEETGLYTYTTTYTDVETTVMEPIPDEMRECAQYETQTPASSIKAGLDKALGVPQDRLTAADDFKEVLSATLTNLISGLVGVGVNKLKNELNGINIEDAEVATQDPNDPNSVFVSGTSNQFNWNDPQSEIDKINTFTYIYAPDGSRVPNDFENASWESLPASMQDANSQYRFNKIEAGIYYGTQEIEILRESIIITQSLPQALLTLDQCIPGPDFGYQSRMKRAIDRETRSLLRRNDKAEGQNAMILRGLELEAAIVNANIGLEMLDPTKNIPVANEATAFISSAKAYNQKSVEIRDELNKVQKTLTSLRVLDTRWKTAQASNNTNELLTIVSAIQNLDASISKPETLEIARAEQERFQSNIDRARELTTICQSQRQTPKIVETYNGQNIKTSTNIITADNDKQLYCSVEKYKVNEVVRWISGLFLLQVNIGYTVNNNGDLVPDPLPNFCIHGSQASGGCNELNSDALELIRLHNPNLHNSNNQITELEVDRIAGTGDIDIDHPLNQVRISGPIRQFNLFEFGVQCKSFYSSSLIDYQNEYTQF